VLLVVVGRGSLVVIVVVDVVLGVVVVVVVVMVLVVVVALLLVVFVPVRAVVVVGVVVVVLLFVCGVGLWWPWRVVVVVEIVCASRFPPRPLRAQFFEAGSECKSALVSGDFLSRTNEACLVEFSEKKHYPALESGHSQCNV
jgi:hypothetical protein